MAAGLVLSRGRVGGVAGLNQYRYRRPRVRREPRVSLVVEDGLGWVDGQGRLTAAARVLIELRSRDGCSQSQIARELRVHRSTVSRELGRVGGFYRAKAAQKVADWKRRRCRPGKLMRGTPLWEEVTARLNQKHSPEQIAARLRLDFPDDPSMRISHETIYQALYVQGKNGLRHELTVEKALRSGRTSRRPHSKLTGRRTRSWIGPEAHISHRPAEAADRAIPGHWEGDLVIGKLGCSALVTLIERNTRYTMITRLTNHDAMTVCDALIQMTQNLPTNLFKTLTWDQGTEMAQHAQFSIATNCKVYFCDPHSPWQRPTNENTNGLIRDFFPKGTDFNHITNHEIQQAEDLLNTRPRRILDWATPSEKLNQLINVAHTT